jgi:hypothetical protein
MTTRVEACCCSSLRWDVKGRRGRKEHGKDMDGAGEGEVVLRKKHIGGMTKTEWKRTQRIHPPSI